MNPVQFLEIVRGKEDPCAAFRIGTIPAGYTSGRPTIQFDGESTPGTRTYPIAKGLVLAPGDRVLVANVGVSGGGVVLCVIE